MKISYRQKILLVFAGVIGLVAVWLLFFYLPQKQAIAELDKEIVNLDQQIRRDGNTIARLPILQKEVETMILDFDSLAVLIPTKDSISAITNAIVEVCQNNNLSVEFIQPSLDALLATDDYFIKVPIDIQVRGTFLDLGHFVEQIPELSFNYYQTDFIFERIAEEVDLMINIVSYIYVINPKGSI